MATASLLVFLSLSSIFLRSGVATKPISNTGSHDLLHSSCLNASYPQICVRTLSCYTPPATTRFDLAQTAVKVSLSRAQKTSNFLGNIKSRNNKREQNALADCVSQISDSIYELSKTMSELKHLGHGTEFRWQMSNAETWVSAALTDEDTCIDGFKESDVKMRGDLKRKMRNVGRVTSNALYLINLLDHQGRRRSEIRNR